MLPKCCPVPSIITLPQCSNLAIQNKAHREIGVSLVCALCGEELPVSYCYKLRFLLLHFLYSVGNNLVGGGGQDKREKATTTTYFASGRKQAKIIPAQKGKTAAFAPVCFALKVFLNKPS